ncbi:hypothetical protein IEQ34_006351 [Dendrobium chrysotoxum]|uniref:Uncharacterized protein n=1 Tax=Dendrobium chrysotoxum TaxID=161865 RepID=A0AAV7HFL8_DENCH|nr:hypothetical protein IEQ34_006098 [Dendrobium chrysotoxum]KAH0466248.1 hypothetical protein IEQ34_006351 [Dendrobium chrysotoxum]
MIVKGNGHTYVIKYDNCAKEENCLFHDLLLYSTKVIILKLVEILISLSRNILVVRLFGSFKEIIVPLFLMRVPVDLIFI